MAQIKIALAGNPNCGKTTLFNALTGANQYVGNWPGVTVEKKDGRLKDDKDIIVQDLPGIYSLSPYTLEEVVARSYLVGEKPDAILNIVDGTNIERNLYLTTQLLELGIPVVIAVNMIDLVRKNGDRIDLDKLGAAMGCKAVEMSALKGDGCSAAASAAVAAAKAGKAVRLPRVFTGSVEHAIAHIEESISGMVDPQYLRWYAIKVFERDEKVLEALNLSADLRAHLEEHIEDCERELEDDAESIITNQRYAYISSVVHKAVRKKAAHGSLTLSDKIDRIVTNRVLALPIFAVVMVIIYSIAMGTSIVDGGVGIGTFGTDWANDTLFGEWVPGWFDTILGALGVAEGTWLYGLIQDGIVAGVGAVLGFVPQILVLCFLLALLEDVGYMARIAFIMDRIFRKFGLSGRAFMPMIMGFGCSIPATINTRTLADDNERTATIRVIPFFSCGAKLPILTAVAGAIVASFGVGNADIITYAMYLLGIVTAVVCVLLMRSTTMRGDVPPFIMELPAYHAPRFSSLMIHLWDKTKHFVKKAFTIILASTIIIWVISHFSPTLEFLSDERINESILANFGRLVQPLLTPVGFGAQLGEWGWVFAVAAVTGLIAKENVISTFATLAACIAGAALAEDESGVSYVQAMIEATGIGIPGLIAFIAFNMTTIPCFAATATARAELPKGKFGGTLLFWLATSYVVSMAVYLIGTWWWTVFLFAAAAVIVILAIVLYNKNHPVGLRTRKSGRRGARAKEEA